MNYFFECIKSQFRVMVNDSFYEVIVPITLIVSLVTPHSISAAWRAIIFQHVPALTFKILTPESFVIFLQILSVASDLRQFYPIRPDVSDFVRCV